MSRITNDVGVLQRAVSETIGDLARERLSLVLFTAVLVYCDARLALVCFTGAPIVLYPLVQFGRRVRRAAAARRRSSTCRTSARRPSPATDREAFGAEARGKPSSFRDASHRFTGRACESPASCRSYR